jgi:hypothetical protein
VRRTTESVFACRANRALRGLAAISLLAGCSANGNGDADASTDPPCVTGLSANCAATYSPPTFGTIFANIFQPNCAVGTGTCHTSDFAAGGIVFADAGAAYDTLLGVEGGTPYVIPDNPGCSTLMKRLESSDPNYHMPRGTTFLSEGDLCTITQWIAGGAVR